MCYVEYVFYGKILIYNNLFIKNTFSVYIHLFVVEHDG